MNSLSIAEKWDRVAMAMKIDPTKRGWKSELSKALGYKSPNTISLYLQSGIFPEDSLKDRLLNSFSINLNEALRVQSINEETLPVTVCRESIRRSDTENRPTFYSTKLNHEQYCSLAVLIEDHFQDRAEIIKGRGILWSCLKYLTANDFLCVRFMSHHELSVGLQDLLWAYRFPIENWCSDNGVRIDTQESVPVHNLSEVKEESTPLKDAITGISEPVTVTKPLINYDVFMEMCKQVKELGKSLGLDVRISF